MHASSQRYWWSGHVIQCASIPISIFFASQQGQELIETIWVDSPKSWLQALIYIIRSSAIHASSQRSPKSLGFPNLGEAHGWLSYPKVKQVMSWTQDPWFFFLTIIVVQQAM